ncbi:Ig-like domain-containing protein, partial [Flavobacterium collinsii]
MKLFRLFLAILFLCHLTTHAQQVSISASQTAASCAADGKIQVTVTNVPTTVYYAIEKTPANLKGIQTSNTNNGLFIDLEPGDYYYGYFDGNTFIKAPQTITVVNTNSGISPTIVSLTASRFTYCGNGADPGGEVVVTMRGGTWPYVVSLLKTSDGSVVQTKANSSYYNFTNVPAGTYTARAVDKCGITFTTGQTISVTANTVLTASNISVPTFLNNNKVDLVYNTPGDWCSGIKKASIDVAQAFGSFSVLASPRYIGANEDFVYKLEIQNATGGWTVYDNLKYTTDLNSKTDRFELPTDRSKWGLVRLTGTICGLSKTVSLDFSTSSVGITSALTRGDIVFSDDPAYITNCPSTGKVLVVASASGGCSPYTLEVTSNVTGVKKTYTSTVGSSEISYLQDIDDKSYSFKLMDKSGLEVPSYSFRNTTTNPNRFRFSNVGKSVVFESGYFTPGTVDFRSLVRFYRGASGNNFNKSELVVDIPVPDNSNKGLIGPVTFSLESGPSALTVVPLRTNILQIPYRFGLGNDLTPGNYKIRIKDSGCFNEVFDVVLDSYFTKIELTSVSSSPSSTVCDRHVKTAKVTVSGTANAESTTFYDNRINVGIVSGPSSALANFDPKNNNFPWTSSYLRAGIFDFVFGPQPAGTYEIGILDNSKLVNSGYLLPNNMWPGTTTGSVMSTSVFPVFDMNNSGGAICSGNTTGTLSVKVDNLDSAAMYFLKKDTDVTYPATGQTSSVFTGLSAGRYWVKVKSTCFELEEKFDLNLSSSSLISGITAYCVGENLSLNITNIGPVSSVKWTLPNGTFLNTNQIQINNVTPVNSGLYRVEVTTLHGCTFTDTATVTVAASQTPTGTANQTFCKNDNKKLFDLVTTESNVTWYDAATAGNVLASTTALENNKVYYGSLKVGTCESSTRLGVTVTISDPKTPTGPATQEFCKTDNKTAGDLMTNETGVTWYDAVTGGNKVDPTTVLEHNKDYYGSLKEGTCESPTRLEVKVILHDPKTPTGATAQEFTKTDNKTVADLITTETGVTWYDAPTGGNKVDPTTVLENNKTYYGSLKEGACESPTRLPVTVTISDPKTPTGPTTQEFCKTSNSTVADLITNESGVTWYDAPTGGNKIDPTTALEHNKDYYASLKEGAFESPIRHKVTVTISDPKTPTGPATQEFCKTDNKTAGDLMTNETGVTWYDAATGGNKVDPSTLLENNKDYYGSLKEGTCESPTRLEVKVILHDPKTPTGATAQEFTKTDNKTVADLITTETGVTWYDAPTGGNKIDPTTVLENNKTYYGSLKEGACESPTRLPVTVTISDPKTPTGPTTQEFCKTSNSTVADLITTETGVTWYDAPTGGNKIDPTTALEHNKDYYASLKEGAFESPVRHKVTVTISDPKTPTGPATQEFCKTDNKTAGDLMTNETGVTWYDSASGGNIISSTTLLEHNKDYYGSLKEGTCESPIRLEVKVILHDPKTPTGATAQEFTKTDNKTVADLITTETGVTWYDAPTGGNKVDPTTVLENNKTYYGSLKEGACESPTRLPVTVTISDPKTPTGPTTQEFCKTSNNTVADLITTEAGVTWYDAPTGGNKIDPTTALEHNKDYYASLKEGAFESPIRLEVKVIVKSCTPEPAPNWNGNGCAFDETTYKVFSGMSNYNWFVSKEGTIVAGGQLTDDYITVLWNSVGKAIVKVDYIDVSKFDPLVFVDFPVTINSCSDIGLKKVVDNANPFIGKEVVFT